MDEDKPRMTADEADARFAALVDQYRHEKKPRRERGAMRVDPATAAVFVYVIGVIVGVAWHDHAGRALVLGAVVWVAFTLLRRSARSDE